MTQDTMQERVTKTPVVYTIPGMADVTVRRETYRVTDSSALTIDLYYPPTAAPGARQPAVIFVTGYPDPGARKMFGCPIKDMASYVSWGRLAAASGLVGLTYENGDPAADVHAVIHYVRDHAAALGIDENRMAVWSSSGNVPNALSVLMRPGPGYRNCA